MKKSKQASLVRNRSTSAATNATTTFSKFICNLLPCGCRVDNLEGKEYLVVPMVILTEGVHSGSMGPLYYPKDELSKTPAAWNHKPIVVYHPTMNGEGVSACDPVVLNNRKVGIMMNTRFEKGKLKSEAWLDRERADKVDNRIMAAVDEQKMMELSTGVFIDVDPQEGKWKSEDYAGVARNFRPDHLALLPDQIGACSIADGAGLLRNASKDAGDYLVVDDPKESSTWHLQVRRNGTPDHNLMGAAWAALHEGYRGNKYDGPNKAAALKKLKALYKSEKMDMPMMNAATKGKYAFKTGISLNESSFSDITSALQCELNDKFNPANAPGYYCWIVDVFPEYVVYSMDDSLWRLDYTLSDAGGVELADEAPVEVRRTTAYEVETTNNKQQTESRMNKKKLVAILMANAVTAVGGITLADNMTEEQLNTLSDEALEKALSEGFKKPAVNKEQQQPPKEKEQKETPPAANTSKQPEEKKVVTLEDYISGAPKPVQDVLRNSLSVYEEEKAKLIEGITANKNNTFSKEDLANRPLGELRSLSRLAGVQVSAPSTTTANYGGQAPTANTTAVEEVLDIPTINFSKEAAKK